MVNNSSYFFYFFHLFFSHTRFSHRLFAAVQEHAEILSKNRQCTKNCNVKSKGWYSVVKTIKISTNLLKLGLKLQHCCAKQVKFHKKLTDFVVIKPELMLITWSRLNKYVKILLVPQRSTIQKR